MTQRNRQRVLALVAVAQWVPALAGVAWLQAAENPAVSAESRDLGIRETKAGRYREGYALLLPGVVSNPDDHEARFYAALSAAYLGRTFEAADLLAGLDEGDPKVQFLWGKLLLDKGDPRGAIEALEPMVGAASAELDLEIRRLLARAFMAAGQADRAVRLLEDRVGDDPSLALELALAKYESGDIQGASDLLAGDARAALDRLQRGEQAPVDPLVLGLIYEYGRILVAAARHEEAVDYLEASVQLAPECKQCWQQMAQAYAASGRRQEAQTAQHRFEAILQGEAPMEERQRQEALDRQDPTGKVLREAAGAYRDGRAEEALAMLQEESRLRPNDPRPTMVAAQILLDAGHGEEALELSNQAVQIAPGNADGFVLRGSILRALGKESEARQDFARALELSPDHRLAAESLEPPP